MPEPITFTEQDTPALSPENVEMLQAEQQQAEGESPSLLAGKYKSVEDLEKAYKELQTKLSQPKADADVDNDVDNEQPEADEEEAPARSAKEIYGDLIGGRLEESGIDFSDMNTRWQQSGELTKDDYGALEEAGFTKDMVDAYLSGLQYKASQDTALAVEQVTQIKAEYGGEKGYGEMMQWAASSLSQEEIDGFNQIVNEGSSPAAIKMAVAGLHARYIQASGREPKLLGGRAPTNGGDKFESTAQVVEAMSDPKYKLDPAYRRKVEEKLARSSIM
jgi:hypothetical protein